MVESQYTKQSSTAKRFSRSQHSLNRNKKLIGLLFLVPLFALNLTFTFGPSIATAYFAFTDWSGIGEANFVGLQNFQMMLNDEVFWIAFGHNIIWTLVFLTVPVIMGILGAALLARVRRFQLFYRVVFFIPYVIASVINAQIWRSLVHPIHGVGRWLEVTMGWEWANVNFLGNPELALPTIMFVDNWHFWGFLVVVYLTAMQSIDQELYEAARIDGANSWQELRHITLPGIRPTMVFMFLMIVVWSFQVFDIIFVMTDPLGGPAHGTELLSTLAYSRGFASFQYGYATAIGLTMSFVTALATASFVYLRHRGMEI
jgi:raffinose/stachyose/melibiose transport system permease protein